MQRESECDSIDYAGEPGREKEGGERACDIPRLVVDVVDAPSPECVFGSTNPLFVRFAIAINA